MRLMSWIAAAAAALAIPAAAQSPAQLQPAPAASAAAAPAEPQPANTGAHDLTKADVDAWLDGFMPYALKRGAIPGSVVVVVKDGQILTERGFGYADVKARKPVDPQTTLFRPGSVSKTITWTAVMQQVQAGKLDLDKDVNTYLDFKIPPYQGKPVTLRNLMTHTAGFAETAKYLLAYDGKAPPPLGDVLKRWIPPRIYAPGAMPAYSNYGASLAGYIVERVSGEPFNQYVARHIFAPLNMTHSTFEQPLPARLAPFMAKGYKAGSDDAQPYEVIGLAPAGSMAASGDDMGHFMIAHLANGGALLNPQTAALMHSTVNRPFPALPGMALGFYHEDRNGLNIIGHGGDTDFFHSDLHLYLDKNVGFFMSMNSLGKEAAAHQLREQLFEQFTDRYFPAPAQNLPTASTAAAHGQAMAGHYVSSRAGGFNFLRLLALLGEASVGVDKDNNLVVSALLDPSGQPRKWREIGPWVWQDVAGTDKLAAAVDGNGRVTMFSIGGFAPIFEFLPAPASLNAGWILPLAGLAMLVMVIAALGWPVVALVRRRYRVAPVLSGRDLTLHRTTRITAWLYIVVTIGWVFILQAVDSNISMLDDRLNIWMRLLQLLLILAILGSLLAAWNAWKVAKAPGRHWFSTGWAVLLALAALFLGWLSVNTGLLTLSLNY